MKTQSEPGGVSPLRNTQKPADVEEVMAALRKDMAEYHHAVKHSPHDPLKLMVAGMVNEKMLADTSKECEKAAEGTNYKAPSAAQLKEMQDFAFRWKKKHPLATQQAVERAVCLHFNLVIVPDESA